MKKRISRFTLVEMLTVIAIIAILAAIITPVVIIARQRGRITDAKSDITSIMTALKGLQAECHGKVLTKDGNKYYTSSSTDSLQEVPVSDGVARIDEDSTDQNPDDPDQVNPNKAYPLYDAFITELTAPKNKGLKKVSVNKRKNTLLDPKQEFDPSKDYTDQRAALYRDPWGNPYKILIKVTSDDEGLKINGNKTIPGTFAVYSFGPNGKNDGGCHADFRICGDDDCDHDDVASWNL